MVHKHNRGKLAKPLQKLKHLDHFSGSCDGNQHTGVDQPLPCLGLAGLDSGAEGRSEVIFKKSSNLYCRLDLGVC